MDDYTPNKLNESTNLWCVSLISLITPPIIEGFRSIFNESMTLCQNNDEPSKYLMTYQNLLSRVPNWNQTIIENEKARIMMKSKCSYLEDLVTCVHIIQLKILSCVRVGNENKKINIDIPDLSLFLHKIYINISRKLYSNIYLFELDISPLEQQKRNHKFESLVQLCIMDTVREQLPVEQLLRQYIDETQEVDVYKVEIDKPVQETVFSVPVPPVQAPVLQPFQVPVPPVQAPVLQPFQVRVPTPVMEPLPEKTNKISFSEDIDKCDFMGDIIELEENHLDLGVNLENDMDLGVVNLENDIIDLGVEELF